MTQPSINHRYTGCGLDNVILVGLDVVTDDAGEACVSIPHINELHRLIAEMLAEKPSGLSPVELRFLRTELGFTQSQLANVLHKDHQTVGRWERGETPLDPTAETIIRMLMLERAGHRQSVQEVSKRAVPAAAQWQIAIDAHDPSHYRKLVA